MNGRIKVDHTREKKMGSIFSFSCLNEISFLSCIRLKLCFGRFPTIMRQVSNLSQISPDCFIFEKRFSRLHFLSFLKFLSMPEHPRFSGAGGHRIAYPMYVVNGLQSRTSTLASTIGPIFPHNLERGCFLQFFEPFHLKNHYRYRKTWETMSM